MKKSITAAITMAVAATALLATPTMAAKPKLTGEAKLARMLEGRQPGKPVNCLPLGSAQESRIIDKTAIVYRFGNTLYVNRPTNADALDDDDIMVTSTSQSSLCRLDTVQLHDRTSRFYSGFVGLQDFVPYKKVASAR
ncbi:hypothetical protein [Novosphingobium chloroacetimidivorans]|nr:hypothetical protein [Novosphingobium chloroacetimidivorans]